MRGQAFIVFENIDNAIKAQKTLKNRELFGKPMVIQFAKTKSDAIVLKREGEEALEQYKAPRKEAWEKLQKELKEKEAQAMKQAETDVTTKKKKLSDGRVVASNVESSKSSGARKGVVVKEQPAPPNKILFLENLPQGIHESKLNDIFSKYSGFVEVRLFAVRRVGFVEYETEKHAVSVKSSIGDLEVDGNSIKISYAKK
ncbi:Mud1p [Sugiyamaella lignohabitans]|uniref:Mud1p n=1 Tax=Sugiyamaella lignohabitans TaxID=796027 RepID=A0A167FI36_9ASCO|nr:Mud1p [Sugiyamaella lignohabitans]ANB15326.1 Mud1p [Sugiyamaella lignohabitans]